MICACLHCDREATGDVADLPLCDLHTQEWLAMPRHGVMPVKSDRPDMTLHRMKKETITHLFYEGELDHHAACHQALGYPTQAETAAVRTLLNLHWTYHGAELWKPPLGKRPDFTTEERLRVENDRLRRTFLIMCAVFTALMLALAYVR